MGPDLQFTGRYIPVDKAKKTTPMGESGEGRRPLERKRRRRGRFSWGFPTTAPFLWLSPRILPTVCIIREKSRATVGDILSAAQPKDLSKSIYLTLSSRGVSKLTHFYNLKWHLFLFKYMTWRTMFSDTVSIPRASGHLQFLKYVVPKFCNFTWVQTFFCLDVIIFFVTKGLKTVNQNK